MKIMESIKILILEHDPNDLELLLHMLKKSELDYSSVVVETKSKYEEALIDFRPEIILSDYSLPSFDGLNAYKIKSQVCPETPFIIVSGTIGEENAVDLIKDGITDYVLKEKMYQVVPKIKRALNEVRERKEKVLTEQQLEEQNEQIKNILESITDGFLSVDENWIVRYYNKEAELMLVPRDQIINKNLWDVFADAVDLRFYTEYHRVMKDRVRSTFEEYYPTLNIWVGINAYPSKDGISILFRDITEKKRQEQIDKLEKQVLEMYTRKGSVIEDSIELLCDGVQQIHPELICNVQKVRDNKLYKWCNSQLPATFIEATEGEPIEMGNGSSATAAFLKEKVSVSDIATDPLWKNRAGLAIAHDLKASFAYPFRDSNKTVIAVFTIYLKTVRMLKMSESLTLDRTRYILQHILENHIAQVALKDSEEKYRDLFNFSPQPMWVFDPQTLNFLMVNEAAIRNYGYSREEFLGMTIIDIRPKDAVNETRQFVQKSMKKGAFSQGSFDHLKKDGSLINVFIESNLITYGDKKARLVLATDITEKVKIEKALTLSEKRFKVLVQEGSDLISIQDSKANYKYVSPAYETIFGIETGQHVGKNAFEFIHPDDRERIMEQFNLLKKVKRVKSEPFRYKTADGNYRWLETIGTNLLDDPAVEGIVFNSRDITEGITHLKAIEAQNEKLHEIAWIQSHVVRAPLVRIMGLIDLLNNYSNNPVEAKELLTHILTSAYELDDVIKTIITKTEQVGSVYTKV